MPKGIKGFQKGNKLSNRLGKHHSKDTKEKLRQINLGKHLSKGVKSKISETLKGRIITEEICKKLSKAAKGRILSEETKMKIGESNKGRISPRGMLGKHPTKESRIKMSKAKKKQWQDGIMDGVFTSPTKPEKEIMKVLEDLKLNYIFQFRPKGYSKIYDFYIKNLNLLIEYDSKYWHSLPEHIERDREKTIYAKDCGYTLMRINEENLNNFQNNIIDFKT